MEGPELEGPRGPVAFNVSDEEIIEPIDIEWAADGGLDTIPTPEHRIRQGMSSEEPHGHD
jgi:hypothetical protein